ARVDLELDQARPVTADGTQPHDGAGSARTHESCIRGDPVTAQGRDVTDRLDEVRLALTVRPDEGADPGFEREVDLLVGTEVGQGELADVHALRTTGDGHAPGVAGRTA